MCNRLSVMMVVLVLARSGAAARTRRRDDSRDLRSGERGGYLHRAARGQCGSSEEVRALGRMVVSDHVAVQQMGRDLAKKLKVTPTLPDNDSSVADYARIVAQLQSKTGADFDKAYLQYEVAYHQSVVDAIKGSLLPAISNPELKTLVKTVLPGFERHLAATRVLASKMGL